jgi:ribosomal-protein-alanine N-acetyltransferase
MIEGERLPTLRADRVERWLEASDVDALFAVFSDREVVRYWSAPAMTSRVQAEELLSEIRECFARRDLFQWGIARLDDGVVIGTCTLADVVARHRRAELGFALAHAHWGHGYANEAVGRLLRFAFDELDLHRIEADVDPRNARSIALLERLGFRREGLLRERWHVAGEVADGLFYGLLAHEWRCMAPRVRSDE